MSDGTSKDDALRQLLERNGGYLSPIDFDDAFDFASEQPINLNARRNYDLRIVNAMRALVALKPGASDE